MCTPRVRQPVRAAISILLLFVLTSAAHAKERREAPLLPDGAYGTTVQGGLIAGERRSYTMTGKKGQQFKARLVSLEDNGFLVITDDHGRSLLDNLPKSARVRNLDIILPRTGKYMLEVAAKDGHCSYLLEVTLDDPVESAP